MVEKIAASAATAATQGSSSGADFAGQLSRHAGSASSGASPAPRAARGPATAGAASTKPAQSQSRAARPEAQPAGAARPAVSVGRASRPAGAAPATGTSRTGKSLPIEKPGGVEILSEVQRAQQRLDQILQLAESGRTFSPAELLAFQAHTYRASQELEMASKVVEKGTSAIKQTLQTQI